MFGHGLNKLTWAKFVERFHVGRIVEVQMNQGEFEFYKLKPFCQVYASTEGAAGAINTQGKVGAVGFIPLTIPVSPLGLVKMDEDGGIDDKLSVLRKFMENTHPRSAGAPLRDPDTGLCIRTPPGEAGLLVSKILSFDRGGPRAFKVSVLNNIKCV